MAAPPWLKPRFNIAPTQAVAVIRDQQGRREWAALTWGLVPFWAKPDGPRFSTINARAETVADKPAFRKPFRQQRCLVPADGFFEWKTVGGTRQPYFIHRDDDAPFAFAGLWDRCQQGDTVLESVTIIVTQANAMMSAIHDRMPVILEPQGYAVWLDHGRFDRQQLQSLLVPCEEHLLSSYAVSRRVNSPANDDEACLHRAEGLFE